MLSKLAAITLVVLAAMASAATLNFYNLRIVSEKAVAECSLAISFEREQVVVVSDHCILVTKRGKFSLGLSELLYLLRLSEDQLLDRIKAERTSGTMQVGPFLIEWELEEVREVRVLERSEILALSFIGLVVIAAAIYVLANRDKYSTS